MQMLSTKNSRFIDHTDLGRTDALRVAFVSTYSPRECGLATYCEDVLNATRQDDGAIQPIVIAMEHNRGQHEYLWPVVHTVLDNDIEEYEAASDFINHSSADIVSLQHEFGIFGGEDAAGFCRFLSLLEKPIVTTLHTVLPEPSLFQTQMIRKIARASARLTIFNSLAAHILEEVYGIERSKLSLVHHGAPAPHPAGKDNIKAQLGLSGRTVLSTFGLLSRGKGIEYALSALVSIKQHHPDVCYLVIGQTHPGVQKHEKESYREELEHFVADNNLQDNVHFVNRYLTKPELISYLAASDVYLTPYLNPHQIVSGTLAYALAAGRAIVSTPYLYARFLLQEERGLLVGFKDAQGIADSVNRLLDDPATLSRYEERACDYGRQMLWPAIGQRHRTLFEQVALSQNVSKLARRRDAAVWLGA